MGLSDFFGQNRQQQAGGMQAPQGNFMSRFLSPETANTRLMAGIGLMGDQNNQDAFARAMEGMARGRQMDLDVSDRKHSKQRKQSSIQELRDKGFDDLALALSAGMSTDAVYNKYLDRNKPKKREMWKDINGRQRWLDDQKLVVPDLQVEPEPIDPQKVFSREQGLRKEYSNHQQTKRHNALLFGLETVRTGLGLGTGAGDIAGVFGFMKLIDPTSTVRETEFATAENASGVSEKIRGLWNKTLRGERLTPEGRANLAQAAQGLYERSAHYQQALNDRFTGIAGHHEINSESVISPVTGFDPMIFSSGKDDPEPIERTTRSGNTFRVVR
ncbi:MAG: hypothetical protein JKY96_04775 [Phycisphaerales bacterium]|nr:hypothetical protein [Phycisphaerales bacterium]